MVQIGKVAILFYFPLSLVSHSQNKYSKIDLFFLSTFIGRQMYFGLWSSNLVHPFIYFHHLSCSQSRGAGGGAYPEYGSASQMIFFNFSTDQVINEEIVVRYLCGVKHIILSKCGSSSLLDRLCRFPNSFDDLCYFATGRCGWTKLIWVKSDLLELASQ